MIYINNYTQNTNNNRLPVKNADYLVNEKIRFPQVLVINENGDPQGIKTRNEALKMAEEANLDLFCIAPTATPPVCRILDFGKYRYQLEKKKKENEKKQKAMASELKEIRLTPVIDKHDIETKVRHAIGFLNDGDRVKVTVRYRGRQMAHLEVGEEVLNTFISMCEEAGTIEKKPVQEGKFLFTIIAPNKK